MNIFSEIYGAYFRVAEKLLSMESFGRKEINQVITREAFADSSLYIEPKIIPDKNDCSDWGLLKHNEDGTFSPVTKNVPPKIVTFLQKSWLKSKLADKRFRLFFDDDSLDGLEKRLADVKALYDNNKFFCYDIYSDGDNYSDAVYRKHFRTILTAIKSGEILKIKFVSGKDIALCGKYLPLKLEYSRKDDKFRVYCEKLSNDSSQGLTMLNIGRITDITRTGTYMKADKSVITNDFRCDEPIMLEITSERNGIERFMMEFASYEKRTELDIEKQICTVWLYYDKNSETEVLIRLLSYGPVLKVISPENIRSQMEERVKRQYSLLFKADLIPVTSTALRCGRE